MSVKSDKFSVIPNWIEENDWTPNSRIHWMQIIMAFSPRDWSINFNAGDNPESADAEIWALWCLVMCDSKEEALESWKNFCKET